MPSTPDSARVIGVVVARAVLNFPVQALHAPSHGVRVVDVDVVVLSTHWLLHEWLLYLNACTAKVGGEALLHLLV